MTGIRWTAEQHAEYKRRHDAIVSILPPADVIPSIKFKSKAEARYSNILESRLRAGEIKSWRYEALTLKLAEGVRFTPDFLVVENNGKMVLHEVKGFMREAARLRLLIAVEAYPQFGWLLVWAKRGEFVLEQLRCARFNQSL